MDPGHQKALALRSLLDQQQAAVEAMFEALAEQRAMIDRAYIAVRDTPSPATISDPEKAVIAALLKSLVLILDNRAREAECNSLIEELRNG